MLTKSQAKYIQSLGQKKHRDESRMFIAEGPKLVAELLQTATVQQLYATETWFSVNNTVAGAVSLTIVTEAELERISQLTTPNQVLALVPYFEETLFNAAKGKITLVLDTIQDPGNLGTIIRIADWFGVEHIVCSPDCADRYNPKVVQATMGSIARVKMIYALPDEWLDAQKDVLVYAAALEGQDVTALEKTGEGIIVIGNESKGISPSVMERVNVKITIPGKGKAESLNAAVATGIILSHFIA